MTEQPTAGGLTPARGVAAVLVVPVPNVKKIAGMFRLVFIFSEFLFCDVIEILILFFEVWIFFTFVPVPVQPFPYQMTVTESIFFIADKDTVVESFVTIINVES